MGETYIDRHIIYNSTLACFLLTLFIQKYETEDSNYQLDLMKLQLVLPFVWDESCRNVLVKRNTRSRLSTILRETPELKVDLKKRVTARTATTIQGLNLAAASKLISVSHESPEAPTFKLLLKRWPSGIKSELPTEMVAIVNRLASWYSDIDTPTLHRLLFGLSHEISH